MRIGRAFVVMGWLCLGLVTIGPLSGDRAGEAGLIASLGAEVPTVRAAERGLPWIGILDGREVAVGIEQTGRAVATAMTSADLDHDGLADVVVAGAGAGKGWITLYRSNLDARHPSGHRARLRRAEGTFREVPLFPGEPLVELPGPVDLLGAGDLNGDGLADLVAAGRGDRVLWWLQGTVSGGVLAPRPLPSKGAISALVIGDVARSDGRQDVIVATHSAGRAELVRLTFDDDSGFESSLLLVGETAFNALALGRIDDDKAADLAVAGGGELTIFFGGDTGQFEREAAHREAFEQPVQSLAIGEFNDGRRHGPGLVALTDGGDLVLVRASDESTGGHVRRAHLDTLTHAEDVIALNLSNRPGDDLLVRDRTSDRFFVRVGGLPRAEWVEFEAVNSPLAVLPVLLNSDPFVDLVVLIEDSPRPTVLVTSASQIHSVNSTEDDGDLATTDGICATAVGTCTLRAAIDQANASVGTDAILFDIPGSGPHVIQPLSPLPAINESLILDATTEPDFAGLPVVELDGSLAGPADGLQLFAGSCVVRGLAINRFEWSGVVATGTFAVDNLIQGNHLGTDPSGTTARANLGSGVLVDSGARGTIVGTDGDGVADVAEGNLISGNQANGVFIAGEDTEGNVVAGNRIGTNVDGTEPVPNGEFGVTIINHAHDNLIGTDGNGVGDLEERNLLSGNAARGVLIAFEAEHNVIAGNYVGTDLTGTLAVPNVGGGIELANGTRFNRVGTDLDGLSDELERNVISGNGEVGIVMFGEPTVEGNTIAGNYIGTDVSGRVALGNVNDGIALWDVITTQIGGPLPEARNVIAGNGGNGINVGGPSATGNRIQGNYIGTDALGTAPLGNGFDGVVIGDAVENLIGTDGDGVDDAFEGNVISANSNNGITLLFAGARHNVIAGNFVGTSADGDVALGNGQFGVVLVDHVRHNRVGTNGDGVSDPEERNLLSGNLGRGLLIAADSAQNTVAGNYIGTDVTGAAAIPNLAGGVELSNGARLNRIGTNADGLFDEAERNVISGNTGPGLTLFGSPAAEDNVISGNFIGMQADGTNPLGNSSHGILLNSDANRNLIGGLGVTPGSCDGPCNRITFNGIGASLDGVRIAEGTENAIVGNVIHSNHGGAGIDIGSGGLTSNDPGDLDAGSNNSQNFPMLTSVDTAGNTTTIEGALDSLPDTDFHLEFYANSACNPNGYGEGEMLIGVSAVSTGADGKASFSVPISPAVPAGYKVCSTATRLGPGGVLADTSEFSSCLSAGPAVAAGRVPNGQDLPGTQLTLGKGSGRYVIFSWGESCLGSDVDYAIYSGTIGDFGNHHPRACSSSGLTTRQSWIADTDVYFLVVPLSETREGSYGTDSEGVDRPVGVDVCHPQMVGECG